MDEYRKRGRPEQKDNGERVRYSDLSPAVKRDKRQVERQEKKEKERTLKYFMSVQRALEEHASGAGDPSTFAALVDGFFVELIKILKADPTLHLLRNGSICRVIERALANSLLLHSKSLLYVLLGHVCDIVTSSTASYTFETLLVSIMQALGAMAEDNAEAFAAEMLDGGAGSDAGSGVPSVATLLTCVVDELIEHAEDILFHEIAARAVRSIVLVLGGRTIRGAPPLPRPVSFPRQLRVLGDALVCAVHHAFRDAPSGAQGEDHSDMWLAVASTQTVSFVVQSLLRACDPATFPLHAQIADPARLRRLLLDAMGCHIFQAFARAGAGAGAEAEAGTGAEGVGGAEAGTGAGGVGGAEAGTGAEGVGGAEAGTGAGGVGGAEAGAETGTRAGAEGGGAGGVEAEDGAEAEGGVGVAVPDGRGLSCWDAALDAFVGALDALLDPAADRVTQAAYALQDLSLFAPSPAHLARLWERAICPRFSQMIADVAFAPAIAAFARKCAFGANSVEALPGDLGAARRTDEANGARFFAIPNALQKEVTVTLCLAARERAAKGAAQFLLVDGGLRDRGYEIARCVLLFNPPASSMFVYAIDKLRLEDITALARQAQGSGVLQQYLRAGSALSLLRSTQKTDRPTRPMAQRFLLRIAPLLEEFVGDPCAAFLVEALYEVAPLEVKEELVKLLLPIYTAMHQSGKSSARAENGRAGTAEDRIASEAGETDPATSSDSKRNFIARKVMTKCCVELYLHRQEDWTKMARRQCQVQKLAWQMAAIDV